ncbi:MAG TPA: hypothetical protein VF756_14890 [Thermoanaerobaculia bacterium]
MKKRDAARPDAEAGACEEIDRTTGELKAMRYRLLGVHASLPVSPREEVMLLGEEEMDFPTEARAILECVVNEWIPSAIRDLEKIARRKKGDG